MYFFYSNESQILRTHFLTDMLKHEDNEYDGNINKPVKKFNDGIQGEWRYMVMFSFLKNLYYIDTRCSFLNYFF